MRYGSGLFSVSVYYRLLRQDWVQLRCHANNGVFTMVTNEGLYLAAVITLLILKMSIAVKFGYIVTKGIIICAHSILNALQLSSGAIMRLKMHFRF